MFILCKQSRQQRWGGYNVEELLRLNCASANAIVKNNAAQQRLQGPICSGINCCAINPFLLNRFGHLTNPPTEEEPSRNFSL
uniref:Uncharacterized protein n=1 Tax=Globodera pallida TaxID=36090 RepID=A0A183BKJ0_GLOPA